MPRPQRPQPAGAWRNDHSRWAQGGVEFREIRCVVCGGGRDVPCIGDVRARQASPLQTRMVYGHSLVRLHILHQRFAAIRPLDGQGLYLSRASQSKILVSGVV